MLEKIVANLIIFLISWLEKRIENGKIAVDADLDVDRLRLAGSRIDSWLQQNSVSSGGQSGPTGP